MVWGITGKSLVKESEDEEVSKENKNNWKNSWMSWSKVSRGNKHLTWMTTSSQTLLENHREFFYFFMETSESNRGVMLRFTPSHFTFSHNYSSSDSYFSHLCTIFSWLLFLWLISLRLMYFLSRLLHYDSKFPYLRTVYIGPAIHCKYPNLALLKYTWISGQVPLGTFVFNTSCWDITLSLVLIVSKLRHSSVLIITSSLSHYMWSLVLWSL